MPLPDDLIEAITAMYDGVEIDERGATSPDDVDQAVESRIELLSEDEIERGSLALMFTVVLMRRRAKAIGGRPLMNEDWEPRGEPDIPFVAIGNNEMPYPNMEPTDLIEWLMAGRPEHWEPGWKAADHPASTS